MKAKLQFYKWVNHWCELVDGVLGIISFGYIHFSLSYHFTFWYHIKIAKENEC